MGRKLGVDRVELGVAFGRDGHGDRDILAVAAVSAPDRALANVRAMPADELDHQGVETGFSQPHSLNCVFTGESKALGILAHGVL